MTKKEALRWVPELKYVYAVASIPPACVAVVATTGQTATDAVISVLVSLCLSVVLILVAAVARQSRKAMKLPATISVWAMMTLFVAVPFTLFSAWAFAWPPSVACKLDRAFCEAKSDATSLVAEMHQAILRENAEFRPGVLPDVMIHRILTRTPKLGEQMLAIPENALTPTWKIVRLEYAAMAFAIAAALTKDEAEKLDYAGRASRAAHGALALIDAVRGSAFAGDKEAREDLSWLQRSDQRDEERVQYLLAWALAMRDRADGLSETDGASARLMWSKIPLSFRQEYPPDEEPDLVWALRI